jgi:hypothetical protein
MSSKRERDYSFNKSGKKSKKYKSHSKFSNNSNCENNNNSKQPQKSSSDLPIEMDAFNNSQIFNSTENDIDPGVKQVDELDAMIENLKQKTEPTNKDISEGIIQIMTLQRNHLLEVRSLQKQLFSTTKKTIENTRDINELKVNDDKLSDEILELSAKYNYLEQSKIDSDVFISGFITKPDDAFVVDQICGFYDISKETIVNYYSYTSSANKKNITNSYMIMTFKSKSDQIAFKSKVTSLGPITLSQVLHNAANVDQKKTLRISSRLTITNRHIIRDLRYLQAEKKICSIRYRNCHFQMKKDMESAFEPIPTRDFLLKHFNYNLEDTKNK